MSSTVRVLALSLLLLAAAAPTATAAGAWSVAPSGGGRPSFYSEGAPGTVLHDTVSVTNRGSGPVTVRLHGTGVPIAFAESPVRIPGRTRAEVPFTLTVPTGTAPGDRSGAITVRAPDGRSEAVPLHLRVTGPELSALTVERLTVGANGITYELVNRGTTVITPSLAVRAEGLLGRRVLDRAPRALPVDLPPGSRTKLTEPWPERPALDVVDVRLTVTAGGGAGDTAQVSVRFVPWGAAAGAAGLLAAVGAFFAVRHRRRRGPYGGETTDDERPSVQAELTGAGT